jgi:hypothetical protein
MDPIALASAEPVAEEAFEAFFTRTYPTLGRALFLLTGNPADAEDIAQEAMVKVWERWHRVRAMDSPEGYVYRVALNLTFQLIAGRKGMGIVPVGSGYLIVQDGNGNQISGSEAGANAIVANLRTLLAQTAEYPPGFTLPLGALDVSVRWEGPLTVRSACVYQGGVIWLPPVQIQVRPSAPPISAQDAFDRALQRTGGLFERCRPTIDGRPVRGVIDPPAPAQGIASLTARCWAELSPQGSFEVVTFFIVSPPDASAVTFPSDLDSLRLSLLPKKKPTEAARWTFVVTRDDVRVVEPLDSVVRMDLGVSIDFVYKAPAWVANGSCYGDHAEGILFPRPGGPFPQQPC